MLRSSYHNHHHLHSFPTRRSSDLGIAKWYTHGQPVSMLTDAYADIGAGAVPVMIFLGTALIFHIALRYTRYGKFTYAIGANPRSEEHTSELQSHVNVVCRLLLAKK